MCSLARARAEDDYPSRPVTVVVPLAAGGANDAIARVVVQKLSAVMGRNFVVENRAGAGGNIAAVHVARARPDGYTLMFTVDSVLVVNPALYRNPGFDPQRDFAPIALAATAGYLLVAGPGFAGRTLRDLIDAARARPGTIGFASAGHGTPNHLLGEMFARAANIDLLHVPYKGAAAAVVDVAAGQVPIAVASVPVSLALIQTGKLRALSVLNERRIPTLPEVPTVGETLKGFGATPWYGLVAPAGTPRSVIDRLHAAMEKVVAARDVQEKLAGQGCEAQGGSPAQFAAMIRDGLPRWARIVKESGASLD